MTDLDLSGRKLGEFVLLERIGLGGHGTVYRCEQRKLGRDAVVKVLHPRQKNNAGTERFVREVKLASRLDHPYSAHVYAFGVESDDVWWIAMEFVQGVTLGEWLKARGPMPLAQFVPFFEFVSEVVHAAHLLGIVHRDLKPSNVMVTESGAHLRPKLLDLGIAKLLDAQVGSDEESLEDSSGARAAVTTARLRLVPPPYRTSTGSDPDAMRLTTGGVVLGSVPYMSPEQWRDPSSVGPATDVYSLGCLAYEALTGRRPFLAADRRSYYELHAYAEPPPLGGGLPPAVDKALRRALAKSPDARHQSALELAAELRAALRAELREQLRSAAQQWVDRSRSPDLLWGRKVLTDIELSVPSKTMSELECLFVAASHRQARHRAWVLRVLIGVAACGVIGTLLYRSTMHARLAEAEARAAHELAEAKMQESELEQGRAALLHGEREAQHHLTEAYKRDPSPATAFMLARAMQPRLSEKVRFESTHGRMWWATFSPDGSQIATSDDRAAQVWDGKTYGLLYTLPHGGEVYQTVYSADGTRLVTIARTMVRIWDTRSGALLHNLKARPGQTPSDFSRAAVSSDGRFVAAMDDGGSLASVWDMERGECVAELRNHGANVPRLAFSTDGWLATTGGEEVRIFDVRTWTQVRSIRGPIHSLAFDARSRLVTGSSTGEVALWSIPSGARLRQLRPSGEPVHAVAFSPDGARIAAGSGDGVLQAWRTDTGSLQSQINLRHGKIVSVEFDPSAALLLAGNIDGTIVIADAVQGLPLEVLDGPSNALRTARFAPDGVRVVGASWDGTARVWQVASPYRHWATAPIGDTCDVGLSSRPDRRFIAIGCRNRPTQVWDTSRGRLLAELPSTTPIEANDFISAAPAVSSAGNLAAIARGATAEVYELPGGRLLRTLEHGADVSAIAFADSDSGRAMVSGALDGSVWVVREDGSKLALQASGGVGAAAVLPDGRVLVADAERRLRVHAVGGAEVAVLELPVRIMSLRRENARLVALPNCLTSAAPPFLIDLERYRVDARLEGHVGCVLSARWVSGGRIVTAGADGTARLWDGSTGRLLQTFKGGPRFLADAVLMSGVVVGGGADGLLRFWDAASGARLWTLPAHRSAVIGVHLEEDDIVTRGFTGEIARWRLPQSAAVIDACAHHLPCAIVP